MNILFEYMYRDAGNYKLFGSVVMTNTNKLSVDDIDRRVKASLIDGEYFIPEKCQIPKLEFSEFDSESDHDWHEFISIDHTGKNHDSELDILDFVQISNTAHRKAFLH